MCPAPPVSTHTPLQLPAEAAPDLSARSYSRRLIKVRLLKHRLTCRHRIPLRPPHFLRGLFLFFFTTAVTLVGRRCVRTCQVCPKLPLRHSRQCATTHCFRCHQNTEAMTYPPWSGVSRFGSVSAAVYWQGLAPLSSLSFSRSAICAEPRKLSAFGSSVLPPGSSRRQRALNEPAGLAPDWPCGFGPNPAEGFEAPLNRFAPPLNKTDPPHFSGRRVPLARIRGRTIAWGQDGRLTVFDTGLVSEVPR